MLHNLILENIFVQKIEGLHKQISTHFHKPFKKKFVFFSLSPIMSNWPLQLIFNTGVYLSFKDYLIMLYCSVSEN